MSGSDDDEATAARERQREIADIDEKIREMPTFSKRNDYRARTNLMVDTLNDHVNEVKGLPADPKLLKDRSDYSNETRNAVRSLDRQLRELPMASETHDVMSKAGLEAPEPTTKQRDAGKARNESTESLRRKPHFEFIKNYYENWKIEHPNEDYKPLPTSIVDQVMDNMRNDPNYSNESIPRKLVFSLGNAARKELLIGAIKHVPGGIEKGDITLDA